MFELRGIDLIQSFSEGMLFLVAANFCVNSVIQDPLQSKL